MMNEDKSFSIHHPAPITHHLQPRSSPKMSEARRHSFPRALSLLLLFATLTAGGAVAGARRDGNVEAGSVISNRAEATYTDAEGVGFATVSPTVSVTVRVVAALTVTPDETEPSATVSPSERVTRLFRVCNTGNTPDFYTIVSAEASAPAAVFALHFDTDGSNTLDDSDRPVTLGETMSPRLARGACVGVLAEVDTNAAQQGQQFSVRLTARSNVLESLTGTPQDIGTVVNVVGNGARISAPADPALPPSKLVEGRESVTASPGQALEYGVSFRNSGDIPARRVVFRDDLPEGLEYVADSLRLNNRALTDADDADEGRVRDRRLEVKLAEPLAVGALVEVKFRARVSGATAPGTGIVNTGIVNAENAPAAATTSATAVVNPFGLVYQGRGGGTPIPGALVALVGDAATGSPVPLTSGAGSEPNGENANPFPADAQGRWSFVLSPAQLGGAGGPARYFLNVTAPGYRARMIEVTVTPDAAAPGLFSLTVRALDGQPVAQSGGFELSEGAVTTERLAAFALNVPMFETTTLEIMKSADRPSVEVGDTVTYRVEVRNATVTAVEDLVVRDVLPASFHYAQGTARVVAPPAVERPVEPEVLADGVLVFRLGRVAAGSRATLSYRVRVGANAPEGEQFNTAQGSGRLAGGETVSTPTARTGVRVRRGVFSSQQLILGRVFEDANANGLFDKDERGLPGVRLYLNNGQSVITDSAGLYNFPVVNEGAQVITLDPVTLPRGYSLAPSERRDERSWTRLLRTPLGGGAMLRQNFALRSDGHGDAASALSDNAKNISPTRAAAPKPAKLNGSLFSSAEAANGDAPEKNDAEAAKGAEAKREEPRASGTYELTTTETLEPVAPGAVRVISPQPEGFVAGAALEIEARTNAAWTVAVEVGGQRVAETNIGERRIDNKNGLATFTFVGIGVAPGPNRVRVTAVGPNGQAGETVELTVYGRGPAKRLEIVSDKQELSAGGRDEARLRVRAFDQWGHPAADGSVAVEVTRGRLIRVEDEGTARRTQGGAGKLDTDAGSVNGDAGSAASVASIEGAQGGVPSQQIIPLVGGEGSLRLVADNTPGAAEIRATTGSVESKQSVRITPEVRPSILVGLAELTVGSAQPELTADSEETVRRRLAFFYKGQVFGSNLLTLAYDSNRPVNRTNGRDRLFQFDPLDRAYPLFGDSSTRYEDAQSNSKLYVRVDRGRSYFMFGDFDTENAEAGLASYTRRLTGAKLHLENSRGDYVSVTGARPDTAYARDVFPGGALAFVRLSHGEVLPGSESVVLEVRDRRNPEIIISRETLIRSVDYNLDSVTGEIFFLRHISTFDFAFNLLQVVATYEYRAASMSSAVYTARLFKTFERAGLKVGLSFIDQRQEEFGSFVVGGFDAEKTLPNGGRLRAEYATSRGRVAVGGNLFSTGLDERHDGNAYRVELEQPLGFREATLRAGFARADEGFLNPFGETVTPGSQRADASVELKVRASSRVRFQLMDERNKTANVDNRRLTGSLFWTESIGDRLRATVGYDFRRLRDNLTERETDSNLVTVGAEWQATDKLQLSVKREQNLSEADPTYPNQTTLAANYQWNQYTKLFFSQRLASAPITPISDAAATGFVATGARRETAVGIETRLGRFASLNTRYQLENGINGTDSFAVVGLANRLNLNKEFALDLGYERGFHLDGEGESFNSAHFGLSWQPTEDFRTTGRYELRDRGGFGSVLTLGAAGRLFDNLTSLARVQFARTNFGGRESASSSATAAVAWRPLESDRAGLLLSYTRRDLSQQGAEGRGETRDRSDLLSSDAYYQASRNVELYGRLAFKFGDTMSPELARVASFTYLTQGRVVYRVGPRVDFAGEMRWLAQPSTRTARASLGTELGFWVLPDLRLGGGYNWAGAGEPTSPGGLVAGRRGFYFTISSKLSNLFDLFGTSRAGLQAPDDGAAAKAEKKKDEEE
jgi:uncharacterized repeat protein (TIGR01451 family)